MHDSNYPEGNAKLVWFQDVLSSGPRDSLTQQNMQPLSSFTTWPAEYKWNVIAHPVVGPENTQEQSSFSPSNA
jgi:hypothetical protein